jgi:hypothetical protein
LPCQESQKSVICRCVLQFNDAQTICQYGEIADAGHHPIRFLELGLATEPFDLGSYLLLSQMTFNLVCYPPAAVAGEPDIFQRLIVRFMSLYEVSFRATPIRMSLQRFDSKGSLHVAEGVGWKQTQGDHEGWAALVIAERRSYHLAGSQQAEQRWSLRG